MTQASHAPRSLTRNDIVEMGRAGRPWMFLPAAAAALAVQPMDHGVRFLAALNLARLGLKTLATEQLEMLPEAVTHHPDIQGLHAALSVLPNDVMTLDSRERVLCANVEVLAARGPDLRGFIEGWRDRASGVECYKCLDGSVVRRSTGAARRDLRVLAWLADARQQARDTSSSLTRADRAWLDPAVIEGIDPPWTLLEAWHATQADNVGYRPRLWVVQADPLEALDGLSLADLSPAVADERVRIFVGPDASARMRQDLSGRFGTILPDLYLTHAFVRARVAPPPGEVIADVLNAQGAAMTALRERVEQKYAPRDGAYWAARYAAAASGGPPLRVLLPISRHSTFVKHAAEDLAAALRGRGCEAEVLREPDANSRLSAVAYLEALDRLEPDLIALINFTRESLGEVIPRRVPFVTWIQDAMPHLFDAKVGRALGPMDFVAGHLLPELFTAFGYPRERTLGFPVVASDAKFHDSPVSAELASAMSCEAGFVTHHSETPEAMRDRLIAEGACTGEQRRTLERIYERTRQVVLDAPGGASDADVRGVVIDEMRRELGAEPDAAPAAYLSRVFALPLADRLLRHQTLEWAAEICDRRGWRLHVYGKGWEKHPRFARYAKGELPHEEALRAAYRCAAVQLHASINTVTHQRVMECALSGGLPVCRLLRGDLEYLRFRACQAASRREEPTVRDAVRGLQGHRAADHPECVELNGAYAALGLPADEFCWVSERRRLVYRERDCLPRAETTADWLLAGLGEGAFGSPASLERRIERAVTDPEWRSARSAAIASRVRERYTHAVLADALIRTVREGLTEAGR